MRVALYARYSTDRQRETSIDDQLRAALARSEAEGWHVVARHSDQGISGSVPVALRPGGKALLADALAGRIDVLVLEGLDRLSRELGEAESITKRLEHRGIRIVGTADGYDSQAQGRKVLRIARGLVNELYLDDLRAKTHRGLAGQFERGYHVGGVTYGYCSQPTADGRGRALVVDEAQAAVVRRIYGDYAEGRSARAIAHTLNAEHIAAPRGGTWAVSALVGDRKRGAGILNNELYAGRAVWNRRQWLKDPDSGARRYVDRPSSEWQVRDVPTLRIVSAELWAAVRARDRRLAERPKGGAPLRTLFAGLLRCTSCGGPLTAIDARRYGCNRATDRGPAACGSTAAFPRAAVDAALLRVVRDELLRPAALAELHAALRDLLAESRRQSGQDATRTRLQSLRDEIGRLVDAVAQVGPVDALAARLRTAEAERRELEAAAAASSAAGGPPLTAESAVAAYRRQLLQLQQALEDNADRERTRSLLADMLGEVRLTRDADGLWAEMDEPAARIALAGSPLTLVAGARNVRCRRVRVL